MLVLFPLRRSKTDSSRWLNSSESTPFYHCLLGRSSHQACSRVRYRKDTDFLSQESKLPENIFALSDCVAFLTKRVSALNKRPNSCGRSLGLSFAQTTGLHSRTRSNSQLIPSQSRPSVSCCSCSPCSCSEVQCFASGSADVTCSATNVEVELFHKQ